MRLAATFNPIDDFKIQNTFKTNHFSENQESLICRAKHKKLTRKYFLELFNQTMANK